MKKLYTIFLLAGITAFTACKKDNSNGTTPVDNGTGTVTKIAPDGFNFATTRDVNVSISLKTNDNNPIQGVVVSVFLPDTAISKTAVFKGITDRNGTISAKVSVPTAYKQLIIDPAYVGLMRNAIANINGTSVNAVIGGGAGYGGDIIVPAVTPSTVTSTFSSNFRIQSASATEYAYPAPYTNTASAVASPTANGVPNYLDGTNDAIPSSLLSYINASLPEGTPVPTSHPQYMGNTAVNVVNVTTATDLYVTFVSEGAGFYNTLGWYSYSTSNPPSKTSGGTNNDGINKITLVFPNASASGSGGGLVSGNRVKIGNFPAGTTVAFCLLQNAWTASTSNGNTTYGINLGGTKFYSQDELNPEHANNPEADRHNVLLYDNVNNLFLHGFEDINRVNSGSDQDFNDLVFYVKSSVSGAISTNGVQGIDKGGDSDGDGVQDAQDAFPNDPTRAYVYYYPSQSTYGNYAFEDNFPNKGDYDMNDVVVKYRYAFECNASNQVVSMNGDFAVAAAGASFKDGFGFQIPIAASSVASVTGQKRVSNYINTASNGVEANQTYAVIIPFDNYNALANNASGAFFINTLNDLPKVASTFANIKIAFTSPQAISSFYGINPFIICNLKRGVEAHLPNYAPTDLADKSLFGTGDDASNIAAGKYYLSKENWPWAIAFTGDYSYPLERIAITSAYPNFAAWAASGGSSFPDWYSNTAAGYRVNSSIYSK